MQRKSYQYSEMSVYIAIHNELVARGWKDEDIFLGGAMWTMGQKKALQGKLQDFALYVKNAQKAPFAIIEAKKALKGKKRKSTEEALKQGREYAAKVGAKVIFASDGYTTRAIHVNGEELIKGDEEVRRFLSPSEIIHFRDTHWWEEPREISSPTAFIKLLDKMNKILLGEGIQNLGAFNEISCLIFFKIASERSKEHPSIANHWRNITSGEAGILETYQAALGSLRRRYPGVFENTKIKKDQTLWEMTQVIEGYSLTNTNVDVKGDAYEWFLQKYNNRKNPLQQYFTPRHIVRMMVAMSRPNNREKIRDPFFGTGGMLVESYKYIEQQLNPGSPSYQADVKRLKDSVLYGSEITDAASAGKMNMVLAGDGHSNLKREDSLDSAVADFCYGQYDLVITNIPFRQSAEKQFIQHCMDCAAKPGGRICIVLPERTLFHSDYAALRKHLLTEWEIHRIISLPPHTFKKFTSAKTNVVYAYFKGKKGAKGISTQRRVNYFAVKDDGYTEDTARLPKIGTNDIDRILEDGDALQLGVFIHPASSNGFLLRPPPEVASYRIDTRRLGDLITIVQTKKRLNAKEECREVKFVKSNHTLTHAPVKQGIHVKGLKIPVAKGDLVIATLHTQDGLFGINLSNKELHATSQLVCKVDDNQVDPAYLIAMLAVAIPQLRPAGDTVNRETYKPEQILDIQIPWFNLRKRRQIAETYKKLFDAARRAEAIRTRCLAELTQADDLEQ